MTWGDYHLLVPYIFMEILIKWEKGQIMLETDTNYLKEQIQGKK